MSNMDHYTKFIAEQARKNGTALSEAANVEVHGDPDDDSYNDIEKIHKHIKAAGHTVHHDDDGTATKDPHVTAHYEMGDDRKTGSPSGFTIHPKAHNDKKLMSMVKSFHKKYGE